MNTRVRTEDTRISDYGDLPHGLYFYKLIKIDTYGNKTEVGALQVYAKYKENTIHIFWDAIQDPSTFRLYRGKDHTSIDGFFNVYPDDGYFCDSGIGVLNLISDLNGTD